MVECLKTYLNMSKKKERNRKHKNVPTEQNKKNKYKHRMNDFCDEYEEKLTRNEMMYIFASYFLFLLLLQNFVIKKMK